MIRGAQPAGTTTVSAQTIVNNSDSAKHVKIGDVELGIRDYEDEDLSQPNPIEITWTQENIIVTHNIVGQRPLTQCTIPNGLWECDMKFNTLKGSDDLVNEAFKAVKDMDAGPRKVEDSTWEAGKCMYLQRKELKQIKGTKDWYRQLTLRFIEANDGV